MGKYMDNVIKRHESVISMSNQGISAREIADKVGISVGQVYVIIKNNKIKDRAIELSKKDPDSIGVDLSTRTINSLRDGCCVLGISNPLSANELAAVDEEKIISLRNMGLRGYNEIIDALMKRGHLPKSRKIRAKKRRKPTTRIYGYRLEEIDEMIDYALEHGYGTA